MGKRRAAAIWLLCAIPFLGWWSYGLFDLDEGFYAAVTAEMNRRGEWITPYFNGEPWFEKPILVYWAAKPALALFGNAVGPRMPSVVATLATIFLIGAFLRRYRDVPTAQIGMLVYAGSLLPVAVGRMMLTDSLLTLALTGMFFAFWESLVGDSRWRVAAAGCLGLAVLAKGPVGGILFVAVAGLTYWRLPELRPKFGNVRLWVGSVAAFLLVVSTWYLPAYLANREVFVQKFLVEQNLARFAGGDEAHTLGGVAGLLFYIPILVLGLFPWSLALPLAWRTDRDPAARYLWTWSLVILGFFSISQAKLPHYILPAFPPLAMLLATAFARRWRGFPRPKLLAVAAWVLFIGAFAQVGFSSYYYGWFGLPGFHAEVHRLARFVAAEASSGDVVAEYQMSRQSKALGTGLPTVQETSHPSILIVLNRTVLSTDKMAEILAEPGPIWLITRANRITEADIAAARAQGRSMEKVEAPSPSRFYALYRICAVP